VSVDANRELKHEKQTRCRWEQL